MKSSCTLLVRGKVSVTLYVIVRGVRGSTGCHDWGWSSCAGSAGFLLGLDVVYTIVAQSYIVTVDSRKADVLDKCRFDAMRLQVVHHELQDVHHVG